MQIRVQLSGLMRLVHGSLTFLFRQYSATWFLGGSATKIEESSSGIMIQLHMQLGSLITRLSGEATRTAATRPCYSRLLCHSAALLFEEGSSLGRVGASQNTTRPCYQQISMSLGHAIRRSARHSAMLPRFLASLGHAISRSARHSAMLPKFLASLGHAIQSAIPLGCGSVVVLFNF